MSTQGDLILVFIKYIQQTVDLPMTMDSSLLYQLHKKGRKEKGVGVIG